MVRFTKQRLHLLGLLLLTVSVMIGTAPTVQRSNDTAVTVEHWKGVIERRLGKDRNISFHKAYMTNKQLRILSQALNLYGAGIKELDLSNNILTSLPVDFGQGMSSLTHLTVYDNELEKTPRHIIQKIRQGLKCAGCPR